MASFGGNYFVFAKGSETLASALPHQGRALEVLMNARTTHFPLYAAGLAMIAAAAAGCAASSSSSAGGGGSSTAPANPLAAVKLAAKTTGNVNSFTAAMNIQITPKGGAASATGLSGPTQLTMTFAEQVHPTLLVSANVELPNVGGTPMGGELSEVITPATVYLKWSYLTRQLHLAKPWLAVPVSTFSKLGINLGQIMDQATSNGPLADSQLLADATSVRRVGTGSIGGVPVTEYTGTIPLSNALSHLSGNLKTMVEQLESAGGITSETFTIWVDGNNMLRKVATTAAGTALTESTVMTITSVNQPGSIALPPASQTAPLPDGALG
jgi:hypothetical protein